MSTGKPSAICLWTARKGNHAHPSGAILRSERTQSSCEATPNASPEVCLKTLVPSDKPASLPPQSQEHTSTTTRRCSNICQLLTVKKLLIYIKPWYSNILSVHLNMADTVSCFKSKIILCSLNRSFVEPTQQLPLSPQNNAECRRHYRVFCVKTAAFPPFDKPDTPELISLSLWQGNPLPPGFSEFDEK